MINAILIDDEPQSSKLLAKKLKEAATDIHIAACFDNSKIALEAIHSLQPDVLFLDIEMPGMNAFQLLEEIGTPSFEIIFVTAYNDYILQALRLSALDFLLKPVDKEELKITVERLRKKLADKNSSMQQQKEQLELLHTSLQQKDSQLTRLALATGNGIKFIKTVDILRIEALNNYSVFYIKGSPKLIISKTLKEFEFLIQQKNFFRVSRFCIVNLQYVSELVKAEGGYLLMEDGSQIDLSPLRRDELMKRLSTM